LSKRHGVDPAQRDTTECDAKLRVWTTAGGVKTLAMTCAKQDEHPDPGWDIGGGWIVAVSTKVATLFDPKSGKRVAALPLDHAKTDKPQLAPEYWNMALSADGKHLALVWRRPLVAGSG